MEKYFRNITHSSHIKGFIAGIITSTVVFGTLTSALFYVVSQPEDIDDYEFDYRGYSSCDVCGNSTQEYEVETENVILKVHEQNESKEVTAANIPAASPTRHTTKSMMDSEYFP